MCKHTQLIVFLNTAFGDDDDDQVSGWMAQEINHPHKCVKKRTANNNNAILCSASTSKPPHPPPTASSSLPHHTPTKNPQLHLNGF